MLVIQSKKYLKSLKRVLAGGKIKIQEIDTAVNLIRENKSLPSNYSDHQLGGEWIGHRECHIRPDLLLIYKIEKDILILLLADIGSHSKLFNK
jgi:mRNA interferase YafQ